MPQIAFLNERSHLVGSLPQQQARITFESFIDLMIALRKIMPRLSLICLEPLLSLALGDNYVVGKWLNETKRERKQFLLSLAQLAPFREVERLFGDVGSGLTEYVFDDQPFDGLTLAGVGYADLYGALAVSFDHDRRWHLQAVPVRVTQLTNDDNGERTWRSSVPHATSAEHVAAHRGWLLAKTRRDIRDAATLWAERNGLLPRLRFLPDVQRDLAELQIPAFIQVVYWLFQANDLLDAWNPEEMAVPPYPPKTTPEHEGRKGLFWFNDGEERRCFDMHGRYTPGAGRIHFWFSGSERRIVIGYVGPKLDRALAR
jgi:hypothetical protein